MTRGLLKLSYKGKNDKILTQNPKICFWKYIYKTHTNFVKQVNEIFCEEEKKGMLNSSSSVFKFRILRNAELVNFISLKLQLPKIYSDKGDLGEFCWIKNIGASMIEYAKLYFDDILIEEIDGDFLITHRDLFMNTDKKNNFNKLIGNIESLNNPYTNNKYPTYTDTSTKTINTSVYLNSGFSSPYSINNYTLDIPLLFCFFRDKSYIPLISNKLREVFVEIKLRPLKEIYTIIKQTAIELNIPSDPMELYLQTTPVTDTTGITRTEPGDEIKSKTVYYKKRTVDPDENIFKFTKNISNNFFIPSLNVEYIFLDNMERKKFALEKFTQIFAFNKKLSYNNIFGKNNKLYIREYHPVKSLHIITKKTDISNTNNWSNYSNLDYEEQNCLYLQNFFTKLASEEAKNQNSDNFIKYLGTFLKNKNSKHSSIISRTKFNDISGKVVKLSGGDFIVGNSDIYAHYNKTNKRKIDFDMLVNYLLIVNGGHNYIKEPILIDNNQNIIKSKITINKGKIKKIYIKNSIISKEYLKFTIKPQMYCDSVDIIKKGNNYTSLPYLFIKDNKSYKKISFSGKIQNGFFDNCELLDKTIVSNKGELYLGGRLKNITIKNRGDFLNNLSFRFFDPYNKIVEPKVIIKNNNILILDKGCGLTKNTKLCIGKTLSKINLNKNIRITDNIFSYEIVPEYYSNLNPINIEISPKKPLLKFSYKPIQDNNLDYKLFIDETYIIPSDITNIKPHIISNNIILVNKFNSLSTIVYNRPMFIRFNLMNNKGFAISIPTKEIVKLPIKIILNIKTDITNKFNSIFFDTIKSNKKTTQKIIIWGNSFAQLGLKETDVLTLFISNNEVDTIIIRKIGSVLVGISDNYPNYNIVDKYSNKLLFGNLNNIPYTLELGKSISKIELNNINEQTYSNIVLDTGHNKNLVLGDLNYNVTKNYKISSNLDRIEYDFGGGNKSLDKYVDYEINNGYLTNVKFNEEYNYSDIIYSGYKKNPIFVVKNNSANLSRVYLREKLDIAVETFLETEIDNNYSDGLVEGIIDYGGSNFHGRIIDNSRGFNGKITLNKVSDNSYRFNLDNPGFNYDSNAVCSLISYVVKENNLVNVNLIDQFIVKTNLIGQLSMPENNLWKNGKSITNFNITWKKNKMESGQYSVYNPDHNYETRYKFIIGCIPDTDVLILDKGKQFNLKNNRNLKYSTSFLKETPLFDLKYNYFTKIKDQGISELTIGAPKINNFDIPLVSYSVKNNELLISKLECNIFTIKELTGFKILDKGLNLKNTNSRLYNGFITKLPKPTENIKAAYLKDGVNKYPLIQVNKGFILRDKDKFIVNNSNFAYNLSEYKNIKVDTKLKTINKVYFSEMLDIIAYTNTPINILTLNSPRFEFLDQSLLCMTTIIDKIDIMYPGNRLNDLYENYKLILRNSMGNIIDFKENITLEFVGKNTYDKEFLFDIDIEGDGGGYGALLKPHYLKGEGAQILSVMSINEICENNINKKLLNIKDDIVYTNHLCNNIYTWNTINKSRIISNIDQLELDEIEAFLAVWKNRDAGKIPILDKKNYSFYTSKNPINTLGMSIDGKEREASRDINYYTHLEKYFTTNNSSESNIIFYSFCLNNDLFQPNGSINLSSLDNLCIDIDMKDPVKDSNNIENFKYNTHIFLRYYNSIDYINGKGSLRYGN